MSMDLGELCWWPLENLADSNDKKGKLRQVRINEIPAKKKKSIKGGGVPVGREYLANLETHSSGNLDERSTWP